MKCHKKAPLNGISGAGATAFVIVKHSYWLPDQSTTQRLILAEEPEGRP